ncbi:MAG: MFS transporter [Caldilineaceae bacterium]
MPPPPGKYPTTATSVFFLLGQSGLAVGPMAGGLLLQYVDIKVGLPLFALSVVPAVILMALYLRQPLAIAHAPTTISVPTEQSSAFQPYQPWWRRPGTVVTAFILVVALRSATIQSLTTLLPKYFSDQGYSSGSYGFMIGIFAFAGAIGTFFGGYLGDRVNRRLTICFSVLLSVPFSFALLHVEGWLFTPSRHVLVHCSMFRTAFC